MGGSVGVRGVNLGGRPRREGGLAVREHDLPVGRYNGDEEGVEAVAVDPDLRWAGCVGLAVEAGLMGFEWDVHRPGGDRVVQGFCRGCEGVVQGWCRGGEGVVQG